MRLEPVRKQVVVITGASSGIGRATATALARRGAKVVISARHEGDLEALAREIREAGGTATAVAADVADAQAMERLAQEAVDAYGGIDTWVHVAAVSLYARFEHTTPEEFRRVVEIDLLGQVHGAKAALPWLRRRGRGALVHVSSIESLVALPYQSAYAASKHGVTGFLDALRLELREEGAPIAVTNVMPSSIDTPLFDKARTKLGVRPKGVPPVYPPGEVARAIAYAAEHETRDLIVGGGGRILAFAKALSPRLVDAWLLRQGFEAQRTEAWRSVRHPDDLDGPVDGLDRVDGAHDVATRPLSVYTRITTSVLAAPLAAAAVGLALGAAFGRRRRRRPPWPPRP